MSREKQILKFEYYGNVWTVTQKPRKGGEEWEQTYTVYCKWKNGKEKRLVEECIDMFDAFEAIERRM